MCLILNKALFGAPAYLVFKLVLEFLLDYDKIKKTNPSCIPYARMPMEEADVVRFVKPLASLLKKGKWTII